MAARPAPGRSARAPARRSEQRRRGVGVSKAAEAFRRQRDVIQLGGGERDGGLDADLRCIARGGAGRRGCLAGGPGGSVHLAALTTQERLGQNPLFLPPRPLQLISQVSFGLIEPLS